MGDKEKSPAKVELKSTLMREQSPQPKGDLLGPPTGTLIRAFSCFSNQKITCKGLIPVLCLVVAVAMLFGKNVLFGHRSSPSHPNSPEPAARQQILTLHYLERPPYYVTGPLGVYGLCADPAKAAFHQAGIPFRWQKTPAKRQLDIIKANRGQDCLLGWFKNPAREKFATYSLAIYQDKPTIALARADNKTIISGRLLEEILANPQLILLRKNSYSYGQFIDEKIIQLQPQQVMTDAENIGMIKMIQAKRADYFFISAAEADLLTATSGLPKTDFKFIRFSNMPAGEKRYLLFSKKVDNEIIEQINAAIKKDKHNPTEP